MAGSYKAMSGFANTSGTYGGFWNEVQSAKKDFPAGRGAFHGDGASGMKPEKIANVTDGLSNTIFVGERHTKTHFTRGPFWADSFNLYTMGAVYPPVVANLQLTLVADYDRCQASINSNYCKYGWGSLHSQGVINFVFGDGSVRNVSRNIDLNILGALSTIKGKEVVPDF